MANIFCKEKAIKAAWIPKLLDSKNKCNIIINNYLAVKWKTLLFKDWVKSGFIYVKDVHKLHMLKREKSQPLTFFD